MSIFDPKYRIEHPGAKLTKTLFTISKAIKYLEREKGRVENLTPTQIESLLFLNYVRPEAATVNALAKHLGSKPSTVTGILDILENKELITRKRMETDRRHVLLALTSKGIEVIQVIKDLGKEVEEIIDCLDEKEQQTLEELLRKISVKLLDKGYVFKNEICKTCDFFTPNRYPDKRKPHYCKCLNILLSEKDIYKECPDYKESMN